MTRRRTVAQLNDRDDADIQNLLNKLADAPARDPQAQARGRANFLTQAQMLAPAVSQEEKRRLIGWNVNFFERIFKTMKLQSKFAALAIVIVMAVAAVFTISKVNTVSAQQILDRAAAAQSTPAPSQGIWYTRMQVFENHQAVVSDSTGITTIIEDYLDLANGYDHRVTYDPAGNILDASSSDGTYTYSLDNTSGDTLTVIREKISPEKQQATASLRGTAAAGPYAEAQTFFDEFRNDPHVKVEGKKTWTDGSTVYVLVDDSYQSQKGSDTQTYLGSLRMVFNADTYQLVERQITVRKDGKDVVIDDIQWLTDKILPEGSSVAWDLSDLKGVKVVDAPETDQADTQDNVTFETLTQDELASRTSDFYVLNPIPSGYTQEIGAASGQPADQPFAFEIHYNNPNGDNFNMQAIGQEDLGFVQSSFTNGSYKAASGLVLYYDQSGSNGVGGMLVAPNGESFLLWSNLSREKVQDLVETLVKGQ